MNTLHIKSTGAVTFFAPHVDDQRTLTLSPREANPDENELLVQKLFHSPPQPINDSLKQSLTHDDAATVTGDMSFQTDSHLSVRFAYAGQVTEHTLQFTRIQPQNDNIAGSSYHQFVRDVARLGAVCDLYPLNGSCGSGKFRVRDLLRGDDVDMIQRHVDDFAATNLPAVTVLVADFKHRHSGYTDMEPITKMENRFLKICQARPSVKSGVQTRFYELVHGESVGIDYIFLEGKLKHDLIAEIFLEEHVRDFLSRGQNLFLCQLAEFVMNGFKMGYKVVVEESGVEICPSDYVVATRDGMEGRSDEACVADVELITYYPASYQDGYGRDSLYCKTIEESGCFDMMHEFYEDTRVTVIKIQEKEKKRKQKRKRKSAVCELM